MKQQCFTSPSNCADWLCPDLTQYWQLARRQTTGEMLLIAPETGYRMSFSDVEGFALRYFVGSFSVAQVQEYCWREFGHEIAPDCVATLLQKLIALGILATSESDSTGVAANGQRLKSFLQWMNHPDGYWILRNPEDLTFLQVDDSTKAVIDQLGHQSLPDLAQHFELDRAELQHLLKLLTAAGMLEGTSPTQHAKGKLNPLSLLNFKLKLCNPDAWLTQHIHPFRWLWSRSFALVLCGLLTTSMVFGLHQRGEIGLTGQQFMLAHSPSILIGFILLSIGVVTLHELAHAFTLKHYGGIVPEVGLMFMLLMPIAYTNTTDQYSLSRRRQRVLVVGAGVICQLMIAAIAFWVWNSAASGSWLWTTAYLLMAASLFTVAINLNPLAKFDGYYLLVALSGINNLRQRSFAFYGNLLRLHPHTEKQCHLWVLIIYAPLSLMYSLTVFGSLVLWMGDWTLTHIPITALSVLAVWAIYRFGSSQP